MYPHSLLPKTEYKLKIDTHCLLAYGDFHLIRRVDDRLENFYDIDIEYVKPSAFITELANGKKIIELPGLSVNLLCKCCGDKSTDYKAVRNGMEKWDGETLLSDEELGNCVESIGEHTNLYIPLNSIHNEPFDAVVVVQGDTIKKLNQANQKYKLVSDASDNQQVAILEGGGIMEFSHDPTMVNYWHFELQFRINGKVIKRDKQNSTEKKALILLLEQFFSMIASPNLPITSDKDPKDCYLKAS